MYLIFIKIRRLLGAGVLMGHPFHKLHAAGALPRHKALSSTAMLQLQVNQTPGTFVLVRSAHGTRDPIVENLNSENWPTSVPHDDN